MHQRKKKKRTFNKGMIRKGTYSLEIVFNWVETDSSDEKQMKLFEGENTLSNLLGYKVFKENGSDCICCPVKGLYFALEKTPGYGKTLYNNWHFNLYGKNEFGEEVMLTKDHTVPKSKGGTDELDNLKPMCMVCNSKKGSMHMAEFESKLKGTTLDWNLKHAANVIDRMKSRYGLDMTMVEYKKFSRHVVNSSELMHIVSNSKSYRKTKFKDVDVYAVYSGKFKSVYTVLDPKLIKARLMDVPVWGKGKEAQCLELYKEVHQEVLTAFKELPTQKETALYLGKCKYPKLMFAHWVNVQKPKPINSRLNLLIWQVVKSKLNKNEKTTSAKSNMPT